MATSKISVFLRSATEELSKALRNNGFLTVPLERESELAALLEKFNDEMYGAPSSGSPRRKQTDVRVMSETPVVYDRDYLTKQSVQELLRIAKAKGCKNLGPRKKESLVEKLLQHLAAPLTEPDQVQSEASSQASDITAATDATDDELRPEPVPVPDETKEKKPRKKKEPTNEPAPVPTGDAPEPEPVKKPRKKKEKSDDESSQVVTTDDAPEPAKKPRKKKEKSEDESSQVVPTGDETEPAKKERKKKEKSDKPKAERKNKADPALAEEKQEKEDEEEVTIAVRSWIHPKEQDKPPAERTRYCIDPITNNIYNPDELTDEPIGRWDDDAQEIIPF
jgi:hypothetical protein